MNTEDFSPARLADRAMITEMLHRWCRGVDRLDEEAMRDAFHPDATDNHGHYRGDVEGLIAWIRTRHATIPFAMHTITNIIIEFAEADTAVVESQCMTAQHYPSATEATVKLFNAGKVGRPMDMIGFARYVDRFERRAGQWKIAERTVVYDSQIVTESPGAPAMTGVENGRRDRTDFIYRLRESAGLLA